MAKVDRVTSDEGDSFEIEQAPRAVPLALKGRMWFGGQLNSIGWVFMFVGVFALRFFILDCQLLNYVTFTGDKDFVTGYVQSVDETKSSENDNRVYAVSYLYVVDGTEYRGRSYGLSAEYDFDEKVSIEYVIDSPSASRIEGMRRYRFSGWAGLALVVPLIGLVLLWVGLRSGRRSLHVLSHGVPTYGRLAAKEPTSVTVNEMRVYALTFSFEDGSGRAQRGVIKSSNPTRIEDDTFERLLYDPSRPSAVVLIDALPASVTVDARGQLKAPFYGVFYLLVPTLTVAAAAILFAI